MRLQIVLLLTVLAPFAFSQDTADGYYEDASRFATTGDVNSAIIQLKNALKQDDQHIASLLLYAELQRDTGNSEAAEQTFSEALLVGADPGYVVPQLADVYILQSRYRKVLEELDPQQLQGRERAELLGYHAIAHTQLDQNRESREKIREALILDPLAVAPAVAQIGVYLDEGDTDAALRLSMDLVERVDDNARLWYLRGSVLAGVGELDAALVAFARALQANERLVIARLARAEILLQTGEIQAVEDDIRYFREVHPNEPRGAYLEAKVRQADGDEERAYASFTRVANLVASTDAEFVENSQQLTMIAADANVAMGSAAISIGLLQAFQENYPRSVRTGTLLTDLLLEQTQGAAAVRVLQPLLQDSPDSLGLRARMAEAQAMLGAHVEAIAIWQSLKEDGISTIEVDAAIAESQIASRQFSEGIKGLEAVLAKDPLRDRQRYLLADTYLDVGLLSRGIENAQTLLDFDPRNPRYLTLMGKAQRLNGNPAGAASFYRAVLAQVPEAQEVEIELVTLHIEAGDLDKALEELLRLEAAFPGSSAVARERARVEFQLGETDQALRYAERAALTAPDDFASAQLLVEILLDQRKNQTAVDAVRAFARRGSKTLEAQFFLAETLGNVGKTDEAILQYKIMSRDPDRTDEDLYRIAVAQIGLGAYADASAVLFAAQRAAPEVRIYKEASVDLLLRMQQYEQALQDAVALTEQYPSATFPVVMVARAALGLNRFENAADAFARAQKMEPENRDILLGWQRALVLAGQSPKAESLLAAWLVRHPDDAMVRFTYGGLFVFLNRLSEAQTQFEMLVDAGNENPLTFNNLAYVQHELGNPKAIETARRAYEIAPELSETNDTLGWILVQRGEIDEGLPYLREAVARSSSSAALRFHLGAALVKIGRNDEAVRHLEVALSVAKDERQTSQVQSLLSSLQ